MIKRILPLLIILVLVEIASAQKVVPATTPEAAGFSSERLKRIDATLASYVNKEWINGAVALGFNSQLGSIRKGKKPGLNLIDHIDFQEMKLTSQSNVKVI